ncbi:MAG: HAD hydrolase-like protein [candidate division Zixibacteria bacterium]|nr:HAD hydrolase-like protein [candidate division Zixibacteria bacterium]
MKLVIFDLDGTLFKTEITLLEAIRRGADEFSLSPPNQETLLSFIGSPTEDLCDQVAGALAPDDRKRFRDRLRFHERQLIPQIGELFEGVDELLGRLTAEGFEMAICSHASREYIEIVLSACGIDGIFTDIVGRANGQNKQEMVNDILGRLTPQTAVMVGDKDFDITAARVNGLPAIGVSYGYGPGELQQADFVAHLPLDLFGLILQGHVLNLIERQIAARRSDRAFVVGINGIDTSGKTFFAKSLANYLRAKGYTTQLIHLDDFHNRREVRNRGTDEIEAYIRNAFDLNRLTDELLKPIVRGEAIEKELVLLDLDSDSFERREHFSCDQETIVIVEGVLLYREPLDVFFDYRIFLQIDFDELLRRAEIRDVPKYGQEFLRRYHEKYIPVQEWYINKCSPMERSDLIIDNNDYKLPRIRQLKTNRNKMGNGYRSGGN